NATEARDAPGGTSNVGRRGEADLKRCLLLAQSGHELLHRTCPLLGGKAAIPYCAANVTLYSKADTSAKLTARINFPIFVLTAFSSFAQPTLTSFSCCLRQPINLPPPGGMPLHSLATSSLQ